MMTLRLVRLICIILFLWSPRLDATTISDSAVKSDLETEQIQNDTKQEAQRLWELALDAKGGRVKLDRIRSMSISSRSEYTTTSHRINQIRTESLFVFPNKVWSWVDYRPDVFGLRVEMYNFDTNMHYIINSDFPHETPKPITGNQKSDSHTYGLVSYLLENKWLRPVLLSAETGIVGRQIVDVVHTEVNDYRIDFAIDRETHLPIQVTYFHTRDGKEVLDVAQDLLDYTEVGGIKVPQRIKDDEGGVTNVRIQFNVEYDESIFATPPPIEAGPEA